MDLPNTQYSPERLTTPLVRRAERLELAARATRWKVVGGILVERR
jgi:hypothetical protein